MTLGAGKGEKRGRMRGKLYEFYYNQHLDYWTGCKFSNCHAKSDSHSRKIEIYLNEQFYQSIFVFSNFLSKFLRADNLPVMSLFTFSRETVHKPARDGISHENQTALLELTGNSNCKNSTKTIPITCEKARNFPPLKIIFVPETGALKPLFTHRLTLLEEIFSLFAVNLNFITFP